MDLLPYELSKHTIEHYMLKVDSKSKIIYWIIILLIASFLIVLPFIHVDVSVQARGFFQSDIEKQLIYAPCQGEIAYTSLRNGLEVTRGDTLIVIESESMGVTLESLTQKNINNKKAISDLGKLVEITNPENTLSNKDFELDKYYTEYTNMMKVWTLQFQKYKKAETDYRRNELLHNQDIIPDTEFENSRFAVKTEEESLKQILTYYVSLWQADLLKRRDDAYSYQSDLMHYREQLKQRILLSPVSGQIIQCADIQTGTITAQNQKIAEISPDGQLLAVCYVKPGDVGLIKVNQSVRIQVDAYNYNEWGLLNATVLDISDDLITIDGSNACFRVRCLPEKTNMSLKNGFSSDIKKGMSFNARIVLIRRSLLNILFDKMDKWLNPYNNTEAT